MSQNEPANEPAQSERRCEHEFGRSSICIHCGVPAGDRRRRAPSELERRRGAFLAGNDTLTWREVVAWSRELGYPCREGVLVEMMPQDPMAVMVAPTDGARRVCDG